jgi:hypothetical protein
MDADAIRTRRWTRAEYDRLIDIGVFLAVPGARVLVRDLLP